MATTILALEKDLFFSVKIRDTLIHHGIEAIIVRNLTAFEQKLEAPDEQGPALIIIDIAIQGVDWEQAIRIARQKEYPILAFGAHMDLEARKKALQAGAKKVVANSKFTTDMPGIVQRMINAPVLSNAEDEDSDEIE